MKTLHIAIIMASITSMLFLLTFFTNTVNAEPYASNVIQSSPKNLPSEMKDMISCYNPPIPINPTVDPMGSISTYKLNQKGMQFVLDNNRDLNNNTLLDESKTLDVFFTTVGKKLVTESLEFKSLQGDDKSIIFDVPDGGYGVSSCTGFGTVGTFKTQSNEKYGIIFQMDEDYLYFFVLYPYLDTPSSGKIPVKYITITEVELNSKNGTQWIRLYNPTKYDIPLKFVYIDGGGPRYNDLGYVEEISFNKNSTLQSGHDMIVQIHSSSMLDNMPIRKAILTIHPIQGIAFTNTYPKTSWYWDRTPTLADDNSSLQYGYSKTWQYDGTAWVFTDKQVVIPEFPFAVSILLTSFISVIAFYRMKFRK